LRPSPRIIVFVSVLSGTQAEFALAGLRLDGVAIRSRQLRLIDGRGGTQRPC
jgi:hypothetical protein